MSARGDARKRLTERSRDAVEGMETWPAYDEHADILAELAETQAALHAATNDVVRLAAELHTAHGQIDRVRKVHADYFDLDVNPFDSDASPEPEDVWRYDRDFRAALDGGAS